jgi:chromosome segregation protein
VTLGGESSGAGGVVQLAAELDEAKENAATSAESLPLSEEALREAEGRLDVCLHARTQRSEALQLADAQRRRAVEAHREAVAALKRVKRESAQAINDSENARSRLSVLTNRATEAEQERVAAAASVAEVEKYVGDRREELPDVRALVQARSDAVAEAKASVARIRERSASLRANQERLERTLRGADLDGRNLAGESSKILTRTSEIEGSLTADRRALTVSDQSTVVAEAKLESTRKHHDAAVTAVREAEAQTHVARKAFNEDAERLRKAEIAGERSKTDLEHADAGLSERFQITLAAAREVAGNQPFGAAEATELKTVSERLQGLGAVNPAAEEEYEEAKERHEFLYSQKADLEAAMADLDAAIGKMDQTSRDLFSETFEAVNGGFKELFPKLFEGGQGRMELTEPDNMLETGIDIIVQPPGKRLQSMTLLSGGEKALTAVALILSIFRLKPTPFCILDEVDAPLDEANVVRFAEAVASLSETTQFLVITHNKRTMEVANTLYGVTMEEPGVSKVVGVRMPSRREPSSSGPPSTTN